MVGSRHSFRAATLKDSDGSNDGDSEASAAGAAEADQGGVIDSRGGVQRSDLVPLPPPSSSKRKMYRKSRKKGPSQDLGDNSSGEELGDGGKDEEGAPGSSPAVDKKKKRRRGVGESNASSRHLSGDRAGTTSHRQSRTEPVRAATVTGTTKVGERAAVSLLDAPATSTTETGKGGRKLNQAKVGRGSDRLSREPGDDLSSGRRAKGGGHSRNEPGKLFESMMSAGVGATRGSKEGDKARGKKIGSQDGGGPTLLDESDAKKKERKSRWLTETQEETYDVQNAIEQVLDDLDQGKAFEVRTSADIKLKEKLKKQLETELGLLGLASKSRVELEEVDLLDDVGAKRERRRRMAAREAAAKKAPNVQKKGAHSVLFPPLKGDKRRGMQKTQSGRSQSVPGASEVRMKKEKKPPGNKGLVQSSQKASTLPPSSSSRRQESRSLSPAKKGEKEEEESNRGVGRTTTTTGVGHNQDGRTRRGPIEDGKRAAGGDEMLIANQGNILDDGTRRKEREEKEIAKGGRGESSEEKGKYEEKGRDNF